MTEQGPAQNEPVSISLFIDAAADPIATYKPPARFHLDTTQLADGEHMLRVQAVDAIGNIGVRQIPFVVANGPGITVTGLRAGSRVRGAIEVDVNAFGAQEPFDPVRAESSGPVPVWTWVFFAVIVAWAAWYGIEYFPTPAAFAKTPTYASNPALAAANAPATERRLNPWRQFQAPLRSAAGTWRDSTMRRWARRSTLRIARRATARAEPACRERFRHSRVIRS